MTYPALQTRALRLIFFLALPFLIGSGTVRAQVDFAVSTISVVEGTVTPFSKGGSPRQNVDLTVVRTDGGVGTLSVVARTRSVTAGSDSTEAQPDYDPVVETLTWADGDTTSRVVAVPVSQDGMFEPDETFAVEIRTSGSPATVLAKATVHILNDDSIVRFQAPAADLPEDQGAVTLTLERIGPPNGPITIAHRAYTPPFLPTSEFEQPATEGVDYPSASGQLTWLDGDAAPKTLVVQATDDCELEGGPDGPYERFLIESTAVSGFQNRVASGFDGQVTSFPEVALVRILDDDQVPREISFSTTATTAVEGSVRTLRITRTGPADGPASVTLDVVGGSASVNDDFTLSNSLVQWADGEGGTKVVQMAVVHDNTFEVPETAILALSSPTGNCVALGTAQLTVTLRDANGPSSLAFEQTGLDVVESTGSVDFGVVRSGDTSAAASVVVQAIDGSATAGEDYDFAGTTLQWAAGEGGLRGGTVVITADGVPEGEETFQLQLASVSAGSVLDPAADELEVTILDEPRVDAVQFTRGTLDVDEQSHSVELELELTQTQSQPVQATVRVAGGTAEADLDYSFAEQTVVWQPSESGIRTVTLDVLDDTLMEGAETIRFEITGVEGAPLGAQSVLTVRILDGDLQQISEEILGPAGIGGVAVAALRQSALRVFTDEGGIVAHRVDLRSGQSSTVRVQEGASGRSPVAAGVGFYAVAWIESEGGRDALHARLLSAQGELLGPNFRVSEGPRPAISDVSVAIDGAGEVHFAWLEGAAFTRRFSREGRALEPPQLLGDGLTTAVQCSVSLFGDRLCALTDLDSGSLPQLVTEITLDAFDVQAGVRARRATRLLSGSVDVAVAATADHLLVASLDSATGMPHLEVYSDDLTLLRNVRLAREGDGPFLRPEIASSPGGDFAVLLTDAASGEVTGQFFTSEGHPATSRLLLVQSAASGRAAGALLDSDRLLLAFVREGGAPSELDLVAAEVSALVSEGACGAVSGELCLGERFRGRVSFRAEDATQDAVSSSLTEDTATSWFFEPDNLEVVFKVLDGCAVNGHQWAFAAGLTDVAVLLRVEDSRTGASATYWSPAGGPFEPIQDVRAFDTCPE